MSNGVDFMTNADEIKRKGLGKRLKKLRDSNKLSMEEMATKINELPKTDDDKKECNNKSTISRVESGIPKMKTILYYLDKYCEVFNLGDEDKEKLLNGEKVAVVDLSILLANPRIIDGLKDKYGIVIVPNVVIEELDNITIDKRYSKKGIEKTAWQIKKEIKFSDIVKLYNYVGDNTALDKQIAEIADKVQREYDCQVHLFTEKSQNTKYVEIKGNDQILLKDLSDYMSSEQDFVNMKDIDEIDKDYDSDFDNKKLIDKKIADAYLPSGQTLIISAIFSNRPLDIVKKKIKWLIKCGADINKRGRYGNYFPALTFTIQKDKFELFKFLLDECDADPNIGSRKPSEKSNYMNTNDGNMPLMVAAWHGRDKYVEYLCKNDKTSINQQDSNGFTALMKACMNGKSGCKDILIKAGADQKIVDRDGNNALYWENYFKDNGPKYK